MTIILNRQWQLFKHLWPPQQLMAHLLLETPTTTPTYLAVPLHLERGAAGAFLLPVRWIFGSSKYFVVVGYDIVHYNNHLFE